MPADGLERKIGKMILTGFRGLTVGDDDPIADDLRYERVGGVILFDRDIELKSSVRNIADPAQLKNLIQNLKSRSPRPLLIGIDQEGGMVSRLNPRHGFPETVPQQFLGEQDNPELTRLHGESSASLLSELGFNLNFTPCIDLNIAPDSPAIGRFRRSFSADPEITVRHARIISRCMMNRGIFPVLKHFPGHGSAGGDTHLGLVDVSEKWTDVELLPFRRLISEDDPPLIMSAHLYNLRLDPDYPATLSKRVITDLLRLEMGYNGVVVSDDLDMKAISGNYGLEPAIELAVNAGVDLLLFGNNLSYNPDIARLVIDTVMNLIDKKRITPERIDESCRRIDAMFRRFRSAPV